MNNNRAGRSSSSSLGPDAFRRIVCTPSGRFVRSAAGRRPVDKFFERRWGGRTSVEGPRAELKTFRGKDGTDSPGLGVGGKEYVTAEVATKSVRIYSVGVTHLSGGTGSFAFVGLSDRPPSAYLLNYATAHGRLAEWNWAELNCSTHRQAGPGCC